MQNKFPLFLNDDPEILMVELMTNIWSNFAQIGQPISPALVENITWEPYIPEKDNYLNISAVPKMMTGFFPDRMQKWESLFSLNSQQGLV